MHFPPCLHAEIFKHNPLVERNQRLEAGKERWPGTLRTNEGSWGQNPASTTHANSLGCCELTQHGILAVWGCVERQLSFTSLSRVPQHTSWVSKMKTEMVAEHEDIP